MRTTINIDDKLLEEAAKFTGVAEKNKISQNGSGILNIYRKCKKTCHIGQNRKTVKKYTSQKI
jgi:hypothetical protein